VKAAGRRTQGEPAKSDARRFFLLHSVVKVEFPPTHWDLRGLEERRIRPAALSFLGRPFSGGVRGGIRDRTFQGNERDAKFAVVN
jgi:hypothetical protein